MFVAARGGAGGKGNHFFITDTEQAPEICEYGAEGEQIKYTVEMRSMAHVGLVSSFPISASGALRILSWEGLSLRIIFWKCQRLYYLYWPDW